MCFLCSAISINRLTFLFGITRQVATWYSVIAGTRFWLIKHVAHSKLSSTVINTFNDLIYIPGKYLNEKLTQWLQNSIELWLHIAETVVQNSIRFHINFKYIDDAIFSGNERSCIEYKLDPIFFSVRCCSAFDQINQLEKWYQDPYRIFFITLKHIFWLGQIIFFAIALSFSRYLLLIIFSIITR